jgi:hypothetical protein
MVSAAIFLIYVGALSVLCLAAALAGVIAQKLGVL